MKLLILMCAILACQSAAAVQLIPMLYKNGAEGGLIVPGAPTIIEIKFYDMDAHKIVKEFEPMHMKYMHLVIVRKDLAKFYHLHPFYDASTGIFQVTVQLPQANPDNLDGQLAFSEPGDYALYMEVHYQRQTYRFSLDQFTTGNYQPEPILPSPSREGSLFARGHTSEGSYELLLKEERLPGDGGVNRTFHLQVFEQTPGGLVAVDQLEPWLMMGGHGLLLSEAGELAAEKKFKHLHAILPPEGGELIFSFFDRQLSNDGLEKLFVQFKHRGQVVLVPFVLTY